MPQAYSFPYHHILHGSLPINRHYLTSEEDKEFKDKVPNGTFCWVKPTWKTYVLAVQRRKKPNQYFHDELNPTTGTKTWVGGFQVKPKRSVRKKKKAVKCRKEHACYET